MWSSWVTLTAAVAVVGVGAFWYWRKTRTSSGRDDRYTAERILSPEQVQMLDYLRDTFPGLVVLPNMPLRDILSVRRSSDHARAKDRLRSHRVDFVVCGEDGRPMFAFDVEQYHLSNAKVKAHQVKMKNRILRTAGVRFLFLKDGIHRMPSPADFRAQLNLAALPQPSPKVDPVVSVRQQLDSKFSEFDQLYQATEFRDSEVMGMSGLMELSDEANERAARQRPPSGRTRLH